MEVCRAYMPQQFFGIKSSFFINNIYTPENFTCLTCQFCLHHHNIPTQNLEILDMHCKPNTFLIRSTFFLRGSLSKAVGLSHKRKLYELPSVIVHLSVCFSITKFGHHVSLMLFMNWNKNSYLIQ